MSSAESWGLHWFRRDLRLGGNPALAKNIAAHSGRVMGFFCFDRKFLAREDFSTHRFQFFLETLVSLREELRALGSDLWTYDIGPDSAFPELLENLKKAKLPHPAAISFNRDYEPFAVARDGRLSAWFSEKNLSVLSDRDHCLLEPFEVGKEGKNEPYQIFTPYQKRWLHLFETAEIQKRVKEQRLGLKTPPQITPLPRSFKAFQREDLLEKYRRENQTRVTISIPRAGSPAVRAALDAFRPRIQNYGTARDIPSVSGTSHFSIYFKNGSLTVAQAIAEYDLEKFDKSSTDSPSKFFSELIWREFYFHILGRFPRVETEAFQLQFRDLPWENRSDYFQAWCEGQTGFPIVDAGMRQLRQTGWMHNRVRMIVASFLTKDLLVDYRWGEKWFMQQLLDGDLAPNNGGWQWAASTGCDAQPYFRIFNPVLQSERWDPEGVYIRRYVPELADLSNRDIHFPPSPKRPKAYPCPVVDHAEQKEKALKMFKAARSKN